MISMSTAVNTNTAIASRNLANLARINNTLVVAQAAVSDLSQMAADYGAYVTELTTQVVAMSGSETDYATWKGHLDVVNGFVVDFTAMKAKADSIVAAITPLV